MTAGIRLVKGRYPGGTFDDLVQAVVEYNTMLGKSHRVLARKPNRISLICSVGRNECDFRAYATKLKKGNNGMKDINGPRGTGNSNGSKDNNNYDNSSTASANGLGGVDGIAINQFIHHSCTVGSQRMRQVKSTICLLYTSPSPRDA